MEPCSHPAFSCDTGSGCLPAPCHGDRLNFFSWYKRVSGRLSKGNEIPCPCAAIPAEGCLQAWLQSWGMRGHLSLADERAELACSWAGLGTCCALETFWQMRFVKVRVPFLMRLYLPWQRVRVQLFTRHVQGTGRTEGAG